MFLYSWSSSVNLNCQKKDLVLVKLIQKSLDNKKWKCFSFLNLQLLLSEKIKLRKGYENYWMDKVFFVLLKFVYVKESDLSILGIYKNHEHDQNC